MCVCEGERERERERERENDFCDVMKYIQIYNLSLTHYSYHQPCRYHNRKFSDELGLSGMFLRAASLSFPTACGEPLKISSPASEWGDRWESLFDAMGSCPLVSAGTLLGRETEGGEGVDEDWKAPAEWNAEGGIMWSGFCEPLPTDGLLPVLKNAMERRDVERCCCWCMMYVMLVDSTNLSGSASLTV